jgi:WD40 repeat protein
MRPTGQLLAKLEGRTGEVDHAAFSPDGQRIVTASRDRTARVYRVVTLFRHRRSARKVKARR